VRQQQTDPAEIEAEIARIRSLAPDALRRRWRMVFGRMPPAVLCKHLLGRMIAWRLQEQAFGGLDRQSLKFLDDLARPGGSLPATSTHMADDPTKRGPADRSRISLLEPHEVQYWADKSSACRRSGCRRQSGRWIAI
jgi:hypothetical protein